MTSGIQAIDLTRIDGINTINPIDPEILQQAERRQQIADRFISSDSLKDDNFLKGADSDLGTKAVAIIDKMCDHLGQKTLSRLISELCARVNEVAENNILHTRNRNRDRKDKIEGKVQDQKSIKNWQAFTHGMGGALTGFLGFAGAFIGGATGDVCKQLANLPRPAMDMVINHFDGKIIPLQHESSLYLNSVQSEKQAVESLKNLPEQLRNLILELMRLELRAIEGISQR